MKDWKYLSKHNITKTFKHRNVAVTELNHVSVQLMMLGCDYIVCFAQGMIC